MRFCTSMPSLLRLRATTLPRRFYSSSSSKMPRSFLSIADLSPVELKMLITRAAYHKANLASTPDSPLRKALLGRTVALMFSKRSTRTRISTEGAVTLLGGHPMFLGKDDIQLGVNECTYDTARVISSMTAAIVARVGPHADVESLAAASEVPVINALSDTFHPLQAIADMLTLTEMVAAKSGETKALLNPDILNGLKVAWVGDANNVLFDLALACTKLGINISVATPASHEIPESIERLITSSSSQLTQTTSPAAAVRDADVIFTDTWVSMGQESERAERMAAFAGFQVTEALARDAPASSDWKFMHCLPRHSEEVEDAVFYGPRSLVFEEARNRLWAAVAAFEAFVVRKGRF